jgi:DNA-binding NarL/FixJ family response regulator
MARGKPTTNVKPKARIFLVEDHGIARLGLSQLINQQADMVVCGEADGAPGALSGIPRLKPSLAVVDLTLKNDDGLELIKTLHAQDGSFPILVVSMHDEFLNAELALRAGARGYIMKEEAIEKVLTAIRQVLDGKMYLSERMRDRLVENQLRHRSSDKASPLELLSDRELEVFQLIGRWRGTEQIAQGLHLSVKTVEYYRQQIKLKLGLKNAIELARYATEWAQRGPTA